MIAKNDLLLISIFHISVLFGEEEVIKESDESESSDDSSIEGRCYVTYLFNLLTANRDSLV